MAYGKPPLQTANVGGWRYNAGKRQNEKKQQRGGGGWAGSRFSNIFRPPIGTTTMIRLIPGQYKLQRAVELEPGKWGLKTDTCEYFEYTEHFDGRTYKSTICSAGAIWFRKQYAQPCIGCRAYFAAPRDSEGRRKGRFSRIERYAFTVLEYGPFCKIEQTDENGLVKVSEKTGKAYTEWRRKAEVPQGVAILEEKEGHIQHWSVGFGHFEVIKGYDALIGKTCASCGTPDSITRRALLCRKCGTDIVDCQNTSVSPQDQETMLQGDVECPHCHHIATPEEFIECSQCAHPARASVFDVDINVQRLDTPGQTQLIFTSWSKPHPIDPSYKARPLDLPSIFAPDSIEVQERRFQMTLEEAEALGGEGPNDVEERQYARDYR
jgi:hypothetical protein